MYNAHDGDRVSERHSSQAGQRGQAAAAAEPVDLLIVSLRVTVTKRQRDNERLQPTDRQTRDVCGCGSHAHTVV